MAMKGSDEELPLSMVEEKILRGLVPVSFQGKIWALP